MTTMTEVKSQMKVAGQAAALRFALGVLLSALSGVMLLISFPPYGLWPMAWVALVPARLCPVPAAAAQMVVAGGGLVCFVLAGAIPGQALRR